MTGSLNPPIKTRVSVRLKRPYLHGVLCSADVGREPAGLEPPLPAGTARTIASIDCRLVLPRPPRRRTGHARACRSVDPSVREGSRSTAHRRRDRGRLGRRAVAYRQRAGDRHRGRSRRRRAWQHTTESGRERQPRSDRVAADRTQVRHCWRPTLPSFVLTIRAAVANSLRARAERRSAGRRPRAAAPPQVQTHGLRFCFPPQSARLARRFCRTRGCCATAINRPTSA